MSQDSKHYYLEKEILYTSLKGKELMNFPFLNKGTVFSEKERQEFHLEGLLPPYIETVEEQLDRCYEILQGKATNLEKHIYLRQLQDQNEHIFYRLIIDNLKEVMPLIYTPTVGEACQKFSSIYRRVRGLFIPYSLKDRIPQILDNSPIKDVKIIVVTDGERILGLGDQGVGGIGISIGKLSLYSACGGINPSYALPIILDVGTNNETLLNDPYYLGVRHKRMIGKEYDQFIDLFVQAVIQKFPNVLLQFEDFSQAHAYPILEKYRTKLCCFNDDIQGTASVCVGALLAATKAINKKIGDHRIAVVGAGSAGCGISEQIIRVMMREGLDEKEARSRFYLIDKHGLLLDNITHFQDFQKKLLQPQQKVKNWKLQKVGHIGLEDVINNAKPTILIGVTGVPKLFTETIIKAMAKNHPHPIIFPLSNPTLLSEATAEEIIQWTEGRAVVATGSPFNDVEYNHTNYCIAQCNNCYIFPGIGLAVLASKAKRISDEMFMVASICLSETSPALKDLHHSLLPPLSEIRKLSKEIAFVVGKQAQKEGVAPPIDDQELRKKIEELIWEPKYHPMVPIKES